MLVVEDTVVKVFRVKLAAFIFRKVVKVVKVFQVKPEADTFHKAVQVEAEAHIFHKVVNRQVKTRKRFNFSLNYT